VHQRRDLHQKSPWIKKIAKAEKSEHRAPAPRLCPLMKTLSGGCTNIVAKPVG
jgi:hypothetical protein